MPAIAFKIRKIRLLFEFTQDYLADRLGISVRTYRCIETGKSSPTFDQLTILANVFDCTLLELLHLNPNTCQFELEQTLDVTHFSSQLLTEILRDREIPVPAKLRFQSILQNLVVRMI